MSLITDLGGVRLLLKQYRNSVFTCFLFSQKTRFSVVAKCGALRQRWEATKTNLFQSLPAFPGIIFAVSEKRFE